MTLCVVDSSGLTQEEQEKEARHKFMCEQLKKLDERGAFILMDSGNYEKSRKEDNTWTGKKSDALPLIL